MKRQFTEYDGTPTGLLVAQDGPDAKRAAPAPTPVTGNSFAMKFLFTEAEMRAIGQQGSEIQSNSGATLATTGEIYPSTKFQELNIAGPNTEAVLSAAIYAIAHIVAVEGAVTNGEENVPRGEGRLRTVVPTKAAAAVIGKGGASVAAIRAATRLHVHVDMCKVPPDGGPLSEQIVSLSGPLVGLQDGLAMVLEHVHATVMEPWFAQWASSTNVGLEFAGVQLELSGKGMRGGFKGAGDLEFGGKGKVAHNITADSSLGVSGELCQFFSRSGWCRWGETCRHVHSGGPAIPINMPPPGSMPPMMSQTVTVDGREVCGFFAKAGWCKFGDACRYAHAYGAGVPGGAVAATPNAAGFGASPLNAFGVRGAASAAVSPEARLGFSAAATLGFSDAPPKPVQPAPPPEESWPLAAGGLAGGQLSNPGGEWATEVCALFQRTGFCKFGDACTYSHDVGGQGVSSGGPPASFSDPALDDSFENLVNRYLE